MKSIPPKQLVNRELSWLDFNNRVLQEAADNANPLLERLKFLAITASNLDEFFMVRVAGLRQQLESNSTGTDPAGLSVREQLRRIRRRVNSFSARQTATLHGQLVPELRKQGILLVRSGEFTALPFRARQQLGVFFDEEIFPALTPVAVGPRHPFPMVGNGTVEIAVSVRDPGSTEPHYALVEVPSIFDRFVPVPATSDDRTVYALIEDIVLNNLGKLFIGKEVTGSLVFRVTRDMDFAIDEEDAADLLQHLETELRRRKRRAPVRLEVLERGNRRLRQWLAGQLGIGPDAIYKTPGPLDLAAFFDLANTTDRDDLREPVWPPLEVAQLPADESVFQAMRREAVIPLFHPFQSFEPVVRLLNEAADDPDVLAIKQTLYRVSGDSPVVSALRRAAEKGKQVTVILEVKARFDEARNIAWARSLEESGAHVIYGIAGYKVHCKMLLIVRREQGRIVRYLHLSTGNYNDRTARLYTDIGLLLTDPDLCLDAAALFNVMTGYSAPPPWRKLHVAPFDMREFFYALIERESRLCTPRQPGYIVAKMNSLVDPEMIQKLYQAADRGVQIELIVRGICCLRTDYRPDRIRVVSIVDRFLEHSRIYRFGNGGSPEYFLSSADWMPRNLDRRFEALFPVTDIAVCRLLDQVLDFQLTDRYRGRVLGRSGRYVRPTPRKQAMRSQRRTWELFRDELEEYRRRTATHETVRVLRQPRSE